MSVLALLNTLKTEVSGGTIPLQQAKDHYGLQVCREAVKSGACVFSRLNGDTEDPFQEANAYLQLPNAAQIWAIACNQIQTQYDMDVIFSDWEIAVIEKDSFPSDNDIQLAAETAFLKGKSPEEFIIEYHL